MAAETTDASPTPVSHYDRVGGKPAIREVVEQFYARVLDDDELAPYFTDADVVPGEAPPGAAAVAGARRPGRVRRARARRRPPRPRHHERPLRQGGRLPGGRAHRPRRRRRAARRGRRRRGGGQGRHRREPAPPRRRGRPDTPEEELGPGRRARRPGPAVLLLVPVPPPPPRARCSRSAWRTSATSSSTALGQVVSGVDDLDSVVPVLQQLGRDHRKFAVVRDHYPAVGQALLATLEHFSGSDWTTRRGAGLGHRLRHRRRGDDRRRRRRRRPAPVVGPHGGRHRAAQRRRRRAAGRAARPAPLPRRPVDRHRGPAAPAPVALLHACVPPGARRLVRAARPPRGRRPGQHGHRAEHPARATSCGPAPPWAPSLTLPLGPGARRRDAGRAAPGWPP